jgi:hypothetical protein
MDADCAPGAFCAAGLCTPLLARGTACSRDGQCADGFCVDGVCCPSACAGQCQACGESGSEGTCVTVEGAPRGGRNACAGTLSCQGRCDGANAEACAFPGQDTSCQAGTCSEGVATAASQCDGAGSCQAGSETGCGAYACGETACLTDCSKPADCADGFTCVASACAPSPDAGVAGPDAAVAAADAGEIVSAPDAGGASLAGGCSCASAAGFDLGVLAFALSLLAVRRRR